MPGHRTRTTARVARIQGAQAWCTLESFCAAAALVPVDTEVLARAAGLPAEQLLGQELTVRVDATAVLEEDLRPAGWARADGRPTG
ncbi:hypothetical protein [Streptacidiphilus anmyonensis]|uniref:hypothetical protein n=1 Tax=Streptacidiphilus anmyonensis TaxID=405782 RepID=UPI0005A7B1E9|nr:hypothetical protein [Streptacidiphilus anmyonensis]